jgi:ribonuclease HI
VDESWGEWSTRLLQRDGLPLPELEKSCTAFAGNIVATSAEVFSKTKEIVTPKYSKPWWTQKCAEAVAARKAAKKTLLSQPSPAALIAFKHSEAKVKWKVKQAKRDSWKRFCNTVSSDTPLKLLWKRVKGLLTPFCRKSQPFISNNAVLSDAHSKVEALASYYENILNSPAPSPYPSHIILPLAIALSDDSPSDLNEPISLYELNRCLESLKKTAPGLDQVHNEHLSHLPAEYRAWLLTDFNRSFRNASLRKAWKTSLIVPIPKPNKALTSVSSFRPISLLSCIGKILESIINKRLVFFLEQNNCFRASQGGFRCRTAAIDQVARLEAAVRAAQNSKSIMLVAFCDLTMAFDKVWHTGLLYKLSQCGLHGTILRWLRAYLADRSFQVHFECKISSLKPVKSGVPQGAILSPLLFNVMMRDLPSLPGVVTAEYADVTFFTSSPDINTATTRLQSQLSQFFNWTKTWGLTLNLSKTKCMCFTNKQITPPPLRVDGTILEYVQNNKYLGVVLDAPRLKWEPQITSLKLASIPIINLLQSISNRHWGADRSLLLRLYRVLICSRLDYAAALYASAAPSTLAKLNVIQNNCLRIALGCRRTTPISSMEIEANIPPLTIHRHEVACKYYYRIIQLPMCPIVDVLLHNNLPIATNCRSSHLPSFVSNTKSIFSSLQINVPRLLTSPLISPIPPWFNIKRRLLTDFSNSTVSTTTSQAAQQIYADLVHTKYSGYTAAFTDGSHNSHPAPSTSAALHIPSRGILLSWKLRPEVEVLESELFAIHEALNWSLTNLLHTEKLVIFSDSQSSILLIGNRKPDSYLHLIFEIQNKLMTLLSSHEIFIQFIPGHKGIKGNEAADRSAAEAHSLRYQTITTNSKEELARQLHVKMELGWKNYWRNNTESSGKGLFIQSIKEDVGSWPWANNKNRAIETALARLRTGHAGIRAHLARFKLVDSPLCPCGLSKTIQHFLLLCPTHAMA